MAVSVVDIAAELGYGAEVVEQLGVLWGKSAEKAGGTVNLLLGHLLDTAAVAERMWHGYLAPRTKGMLDELAGDGNGLRLFMWLCGVHDCGKATPAFQAQHEALGERVRRAGLSWRPAEVKRRTWRHDQAGAVLLRDLLLDPEVGGWDREQGGWVWPLVAGHHGSFPSAGIFQDRRARGEHQGHGPAWRRVQRAVVELFTRALGYRDVAAVQPARRPSRAEQLQLSGLIVMADWIASDERHFIGVDRLASISLAGSRARAGRAWERLGLRGGWGRLSIPDGDVVLRRFGEVARSSQRQLVDVVTAMPAPGLLIVEAPMGEGKTKAAFAAAEVLAARFGLDGVFLAMPTQATCDPMFTQMRAWAATFGGGLEREVVLLHGKRMFNPEWKHLVDGAAGAQEWYDSVDEYGGPDAAERLGPADWFHGRKRGLLAGFGVGTIDQVLHAATRTRHVMLRFAGLAGKVVIVDEVHAADIYMEQFLGEALRWLGQAGVPVILLSATLAPRQRRELVESYLGGALGEPYFEARALPAPAGYPAVTAAFADPATNAAGYVTRDAHAWRPSQPVGVEILAAVAEDPASIVDILRHELADGGVALVIHNTVERAQRTFTAVRAEFGGDARLLHGRLCAADRATRTADCIARLGPGARRDPTLRLILVATQVAEQSFDVDSDLLITDLAPVDLLLQRIGRLHRHGETARPDRFEQRPRVIVTGFDDSSGRVRFATGSESIYGRYPLLRTAALVRQATTTGWSIPAEVPALVATVYGDDPLCPDAWRHEEESERERWWDEQAKRADAAQGFLLAARGGATAPTLDGLHYGETHGVRDEEELRAIVRDGEETVEVILVRERADGYTSLGGSWLGVNGEAAEEVLEEVIGGTVRLPHKLTRAAKETLSPLPGWAHPWLRHAAALPLDERCTAELGGYRVRYDPDLGLVVAGTT